MNSSEYKNSQLKYLCAIIGCKPYEVEYITTHLDEYYNEWFEEKIDKTTGDYKKYQDGTIKKRAIRPSLNRLKVIQLAIKNKILATIPVPDNIHGGMKKKSNISNSKPHQGKKFRLTTDLQDFYPNIKHSQVYHAFLLLGYSDHIAHWLTKLTTWKYELPQGTHTSTHIANLAFLETDIKLISLCKQNNLTYTRFIDDLTFSSQQDFKPILNDILQIIKDGGFKINYRKTKYTGDQTVTGIEIFNNFIDAPEKIKLKVAAEKLVDSKSKPYSNYLNAIRRTNRNMMIETQPIDA